MEFAGSSPGAKEDSESLLNAASVESVVRYIKKLVHLVTEADDESIDQWMNEILVFMCHVSSISLALYYSPAPSLSTRVTLLDHTQTIAP